MNNSNSQTYQQPVMEMLELNSAGICAASGKNTFTPSHFDNTEVQW